MTNKSVAGRFAMDHGKRTNVMARKRACAALTLPWLLPPEGHTEDAKLIETFQDVGAVGASTLAGNMLLDAYPVDRPFFELVLSPLREQDPREPAEKIQAAKDSLALLEIVLQGLLESAQRGKRTNRRTLGFRANKYLAIEQFIVLGDVLERIDDDYRVTPIRFDQYVTNRDSSGDVNYHIVEEKIDPLAALGEEQLALLDLDINELQQQDGNARECTMHTLVEWQPWTRKWIVRQEVKGKTVNEFDKKFSPYISTVHDLAPPEHYGRSLIEQHIGDLRTLNELEMRAVDIVAMAAKYVPVKDYSSLTKDADLLKDSGVPIRARVVGGVVQDLAILQAQKSGDMMLVDRMIERKHQGLGRAFLIESAATPTGERVTATQVNRVTAEVDMARGGPLASFAEQNQKPLVEYLLAQAQDDLVINRISDGIAKDIEIRSLTGVASITRAVQTRRVLTLAQIMAQLGQNAMDYIKPDVLARLLQRYTGVNERGLVKTEDERQAEQQAAMQQQLAMAAGEEGVKAVGAAVKERLAAQAQQ